MRTITLFLACLMTCMGVAQAQSTFSILFVDDSDDAFGNAPYFASALDSVGVAYTYFNAVDSAASPTDTYMSNFDLVIWHTSTDDGGLYLWNGADEDNTRLKTYLDNGGMVWIVGNDFLYDRFGAPTTTWQAGDFMYDYLGVRSYDLQAYGSDGGIGLPQADADTAQPITGLPTLNWQFSTLWWPDGVSLRTGAVPIYRMGGSTYTFADSVTGSWYDNGTSRALAFYFDLSLANNFGLIRSTTGAVVSFFGQLADTTSSIQDFPATDFRVFPNPSQGGFLFSFELNTGAGTSATLVDLQGRTVAKIFSEMPLSAGQHQFDWKHNGSVTMGTYFLRIESEGRVMTRPVLILN